MNEFGFAEVACITPRVHITDPHANAKELLQLHKDECWDSDIILTPELSIPSYSALKLFNNSGLEDECTRAIIDLAGEVRSTSLFVVGTHISVENGLYNCAVVLNGGRPIAAVPKEFIPNYAEFEEGQWFAVADDKDIPSEINFGGWDIPFGTRLLFRGRHPIGNSRRSYDSKQELVAFIELCEAIWMIIPPSSFGALAGANVLLNPSASTETIGKAEQRRGHVLSQSGRCQAVYAYCSSGPTESTSDTVMSGHDIIAEGGSVLAETDAIGDDDTPPNREGYVIKASVDIEKCMKDRRAQTSYTQAHRYIRNMDFRDIEWEARYDTLSSTPNMTLKNRNVTGHPFVPTAGPELHKRCARIFNLKQCSLAKRLECLGHSPKTVQGISGGLDSTAALMHVVYTFDMLGIPRTNHTCVTMPGFGTTARTKGNAWKLMQAVGVTALEIDIRPACLEEMKVFAQTTGYKPFGVIDLSKNDPHALLSQLSVDAIDDLVDRYNITLGAGATRQIAHEKLAVVMSDVDQFEALLRDLPAEARANGDLKFENIQARRRTEYLMNMGFVIGTGDMSELDQGWCTYNADHQSMFNTNCSTPKTLIKFEVEYIARHRTPEGLARDTLLDIVATEISPELLPPAADGTIAQSTEDNLGPYELIDFRMFHHVRNGFSPRKILWLANQVQDWNGTYNLDDLYAWQTKQIKRNFAAQYKRDDVPNGPKLGSVSYSPRSGNWRQASDSRPDGLIANLRGGYDAISNNMAGKIDE